MNNLEKKVKHHIINNNKTTSQLFHNWKIIMCYTYDTCPKIDILTSPVFLHSLSSMTNIVGVWVSKADMLVSWEIFIRRLKDEFREQEGRKIEKINYKIYAFSSPLCKLLHNMHDCVLSILPMCNPIMRTLLVPQDHPGPYPNPALFICGLFDKSL